ncbi:hypothetical protein HJB86_01160 [Rhizobium sp. NZLR3b]|uniref:hypothetical protein n=1 Tax=Rhizobium sp. NZLR3b TaxID=2731101 RepID=UPI001C83A9D3|nr:hypothetical protein [Rhizobium sp. NZLR3b]MBX5187522.1 hypothetical protein [Rhizobium sp. NZLR3b]
MEQATSSFGVTLAIRGPQPLDIGKGVPGTRPGNNSRNSSPPIRIVRQPSCPVSPSNAAQKLQFMPIASLNIDYA